MADLVETNLIDFMFIHPQYLDVWSNLNNAGKTATGKLTGFSTILFVLVIVMAAILLAFGGRMGDKAKTLLMYALGATALVALAPVIVPTIKSLFK